MRKHYRILLFVISALFIIFSCISKQVVINETPVEEKEEVIEYDIPKKITHNIIYSKWFDAVSCGNTNILSLMLEQGFEINSVGNRAEGYDYGFTALMLASSLGDYKTVMFLLSKNASINFKTLRGSALLSALDNNQVRIANILISKNCDVNISSMDGRTPLMAAAYNGNYELCKTLINKGAKVDAIHSSGYRAIDYAMSNGYKDIVDILKN